MEVTMLRRFAAVVAVALSFALGSAYAQDTADTDSDMPVRNDGVTTARDDDRGFDMGWLGMIGLAGLAGLLPRDRHDRNNGARHTAH
jgi:hypothetical protein